ncbi:hypothetical protein KC19_VG135400 [Ceratodon purpureus]|uniref:Uncharacterized protein n=1 Tax=Ceratodon purpureus TaxID=3225 RepID=A0A8T0HQV4_CERPU|nr:hypothetical protein KC19_VG135400 [Ceratodon purpureus]
MYSDMRISMCSDFAGLWKALDMDLDELGHEHGVRSRGSSHYGSKYSEPTPSISLRMSSRSKTTLTFVFPTRTASPCCIHIWLKLWTVPDFWKCDGYAYKTFSVVATCALVVMTLIYGPLS